MTSRFSSLGVGRWALGVERFLLLFLISRAFAAQVFTALGPGMRFPTTTA